MAKSNEPSSARFSVTAKHRVQLIVALVLAFGAGWIAASVVPEFLAPRVKSDWFEMTRAAALKGITYSLEAFAKADIPLPEINEVSGTGKFVTNGSGRSSSIHFGYKTSVKIAPLDVSKIPAKYRKEKSVDIGRGKTITQLPVDQVSYEAKFDFVLKDKDGFTLLELPSAVHTIESGKVNTFQALAPDAVPIGIASRVTQVVLDMTIMKCVTCDGE